jgi:enoyl-CoA hydratase
VTSTNADAPHCLVEQEGHKLVVTMNRPEARNALSGEMLAIMSEAWDRVNDDPEIRVCILTGAGGYFCAGMDLKAFARGERPHVPGRGFGGLVERPPRKPLVAAVEGFAVAGGMELALACDLIVAARGARFGLPEVRRGLVPAAGGLLALPALVPRGAALELVLTGAPISSERAYELGLVTRLAEPGAALDEALALAAAIAANAPLATVAAKAILDQAPGWPADEAWARQRAIADPVIGSDDAREGARAFAQKRAARWQGR